MDFTTDGQKKWYHDTKVIYGPTGLTPSKMIPKWNYGPTVSLRPSFCRKVRKLPYQDASSECSHYPDVSLYA